jgi:tetratricopeptide (TPR) repeat protein
LRQYGYGPAIGRDYVMVGSEAMKKGTYGMAGILFKRAVENDPDLQIERGRQYLELGKLYLDQQQNSTADSLFSIAVQYDPSMIPFPAISQHTDFGYLTG